MITKFSNLLASSLLMLLLLACASQAPVQEPAPPPPKPKPKPPVKKKVDMYRFVPPRKHLENDADRVRDQITSNNSYYTYLYKQHKEIHLDLKGSFVVEMEITESGYIVDIKITESSMTHKALEKEIVKFLKKLEFGNMEDGDLTVVYEFVF